MIQRIKLLLDTENLTVGQFATTINFSNSAMSHVMSGRNNPSLEFVSNTLLAFPNISSDWLLFGKGKMYKDDFLPENNPSKGSNLFAPIIEIPQVKENVNIEEKNNIEEENTLPDIPSESKIQETDKDAEKIFDSRELKKEENIEKKPTSICPDDDNITQIIVFFENGKYKNFVQK